MTETKTPVQEIANTCAEFLAKHLVAVPRHFEERVRTGEMLHVRYILPEDSLGLTHDPDAVLKEALAELALEFAKKICAHVGDGKIQFISPDRPCGTAEWAIADLGDPDAPKLRVGRGFSLYHYACGLFFDLIFVVHK